MAGGEPKKSDLGVRTASAVVMVAVAGTSLWLGGWVWTVFVAAVALGVLWEWRGLVVGFVPSSVRRGLWNAGGLVYVGLAALVLAWLRSYSPIIVLLVAGAVIATDIGAYFSGRALGGPKIAPRISPSKTWAGLLGGILLASLAIYYADGFACRGQADSSVNWFDCKKMQGLQSALIAIGFGSLLAIIAQSGDFFESWMKRRAGVKDSGKLIPGHGGLFDRVDGLLAVCFVIGLYALVTIGGTLLTGGSLLPSPA